MKNKPTPAPAAPTPPRHLSAEAKAWWSAVVSEYQLEDHHRKLLTLAGESWDRSTIARKIIEREGLTFTDKAGQPKAHPAAIIERDAKTTFARLLRELMLDESASEPQRPPRSRRG